MKEHVIKDDILGYLCLERNNKKRNSAKDISEHLNLDVNTVLWCLDDLIHLKVVGFDNMGNVTTENIHTHRVHWVNHRGRFFLNQSGGFSKLKKQEKRMQMWIIAKTTSAILNAIAILCIGVWGIYVADKSNKVEKLESEIQFLKHENDSLMNHSHFLFGKLNGQKPRQ